MKLPTTAAIARLLGAAALSLSLATVATQASAVPVALINGSGQLTGTTGVTVGALTYNVSFVDGSCNSLFGGCVNANFDFHSIADAIAASQALFTQVINGFGNHPDKIFGCGGNGCQIETPGTTLVETAVLIAQGGRIILGPLFFGTGGSGIQAAFDTSGNNLGGLRRLDSGHPHDEQRRARARLSGPAGFGRCDVGLVAAQASCR